MQADICISCSERSYCSKSAFVLVIEGVFTPINSCELCGSGVNFINQGNVV